MTGNLLIISPIGIALRDVCIRVSKVLCLDHTSLKILYSYCMASNIINLFLTKICCMRPAILMKDMNLFQIEVSQLDVQMIGQVLYDNVLVSDKYQQAHGKFIY